MIHLVEYIKRDHLNYSSSTTMLNDIIPLTMEDEASFILNKSINQFIHKFK